MVNFKLSVFALALAPDFLTGAESENPSLRKIILEIPEDNFRGRIERAYMAGDFNEVESVLTNYLDEYDFENGEVEDVHGAREKAKEVIHESVEEKKAAALTDQVYDEANQSPTQQMTAAPTSQQDYFDAMKVVMEEAAIPDEDKKELDEFASNSTKLVEIEAYFKHEYEEFLETFHKEYPNMSAEHGEKIGKIVVGKYVDYLREKGAPDDVLDAVLSEYEVDPTSDDSFFGKVKSIFEAWEVPDNYLKNETLQALDNWFTILTFLDGYYRARVAIVHNKYPFLNEEHMHTIVDILVNKVKEYLRKKGVTVPEPEEELDSSSYEEEGTQDVVALVSDKSSIVNALRDTVGIQKKIMELLNKLEGGI